MMNEILSVHRLTAGKRPASFYKQSKTMPIDLEKEIMEIKERLAGIDAKLELMTGQANSYFILESRVRKVENKQSAMIGWAIGAGAVISLVVSWAIKVL